MQRGSPSLGLLVSASQITLYRECPRKWAWRYLQKIETPPHPAALLGIEVDDTQLQPYFRDGRPLDLSRASGHIAKAGLHLLPKPKTPGLVLQHHFTMPSPTWNDGEHIGFGFQGYEDMWLPDSAAVPDLPGGVPFVGDFKTIKNLRWAKNEATLRIDVQAMLYATHALYSTRAKAVDLAWVYFETQPHKFEIGLEPECEPVPIHRAKRTYLRVEANHVIKQFQDINETAVEMFKVRKLNPHPTDLPPNSAMCDKYGGCPFTHLCNLSPFETNDGGIVDANELLAKLKAKKAAAAGESAVAPVADPPLLQIQEPKKVLPINPPESALVQNVETSPQVPTESPKRGRPKKETPVVGQINPPELVAVNPDELAEAILNKIVARLQARP